jgi:hypothetical protein
MTPNLTAPILIATVRAGPDAIVQAGVTRPYVVLLSPQRPGDLCRFADPESCLARFLPNPPALQ